MSINTIQSKNSEFTENVSTPEVYTAFDPGLTTGFLLAIYFPDRNELTVLGHEPILLNTRHQQIKLGTPPMECFEDFYKRVAEVYDTLYHPDKYIHHTAIENFIGGTGGDVQNTVNKLIGMIMAVCYQEVQDSVSGDCLHDVVITTPKIYKNSTRYRFQEYVTKYCEGRSISPHSKDAFMHLLHRLTAEHPNCIEKMHVGFAVT